MTIKDALKTGFNKKVETERKLHRSFPSNKGYIIKITPEGVGVNFGGNWNVWFWAKGGGDGRKSYMKELKVSDE